MESNGNYKEEILAKSRELKKDEGLEHAQSKGNHLGEIILSAVGLPIAIYSIVIGEYAIAWACGAIVFAFVLGQSITVYRFTKRKYHLAWVVLSVLMMIFFPLQFLAETQGWWVTWGWLADLLSR